MNEDERVQELVEKLSKDEHPDLAYDGSSNEPQARVLTARERDIIYRIVSEILRGAHKVTYDDVPDFLRKGWEVTLPVYPSEFENLLAIRRIISPRVENRPDLWDVDDT